MAFPSMLKHPTRRRGLAATVVVFSGIASLLLGGAIRHRSTFNKSVSHHSLPALFYRDSSNGALVGHAGSLTVWFNPSAITYRTSGGDVQVSFIGSHTVQPQGNRKTGNLNVIRTGEEQVRQRTAQLYEKVIYRDLYEGIDLIYRGWQNGLKSEYLVSPGVNPSQIRFRFASGAQVHLMEGDLVVRTPHAVLRERAPEIYQEGQNRNRIHVPGKFRVFDGGEIGFSIGRYDSSRPLIIDPQVTFSTYWGGSMRDALTSVAIAADGSVYVCGWTESTDVPVLSGVQTAFHGSTDAFVMKLSPSNAVVYATYLGGSGQDQANAIAVDSANNAYVAGWTSSQDFPVLGALQSTLLGARNAFVTKLTPSGTLAYSTYLGGSGADSANAIQVDAGNAIYIAGQTTSTNFPVLNAFQASSGKSEDAFVAKIAPSGNTLLYSTYLGGAGNDEAYGLSVLNGEAYVTGATDSVDFPTANAFQASNQGGQDAFVTKISASGRTLGYSTYLGGSNGMAGLPEIGYGIAVTSAGEAVVVGTTSSASFPVVSPIQGSFMGGGNDAFVSKLTAAGTALEFSTYLGGSGQDIAKSVAIASSGNLFIAGQTSSQDMQVINPVQSTNAGTINAFLAAMPANGSSLQFSSYFGGSGIDAAAGVAVDPNANPIIVGSTTSWNLPLNAPLQSTNGGNGGGFLARFAAVTPPPRIGVYETGRWLLDFNNGQNIWFGIPGDIPVVGDWDGSGRSKIGVYRGGQWFLDYNGNYQWDGFGADRAFWFGLPGDVPVVGDWDGTGHLRIGVYRNGQWFVDLNGNYQWDGFAKDRAFWFGLPGDVPVVGDWDGSGHLRIGVYRNGQWFVDLNGNFQWDGGGIDSSFWFGLPGDIPVVADWDGTGWLRIGVYRNGIWYADLNGNREWDGIPTDGTFTFGALGDTPVTFIR